MSLGSFGKKPIRRRWVLGITITVAAAAVALLVASQANAQVGSPSGFESGDGNMIHTGTNHDWDNVSFTHVTDLASTQSDDSFVSGQLQDTICPDTYQHGNPPKDDFTDVASFFEVSGSGVPFLYGATIRYTANGSASENVELKQGTSGLCAGSTTLLARTPGDKLLAFDYTGGGASVDLHVLTWIDAAHPNLGGNSGACFVANDPLPCWGANVIHPSASAFEGAASSATITAGNNPISNVALTAGKFAEFGVNLQATGIIPAGTCFATAQTIWESRSSGSSFVSTTKDIAIENQPFSNCGVLKVIKQTNPRGLDKSFGFTSDLPGGTGGVACPTTTGVQADGSFCLNDTGNTTADSDGNTLTAGNLAPKTYTITEGADPTGFAFKDVTCTDPDAVEITGKQVKVTLASGDSITCTYTNDQQLGAIKVTKQSVKTGNPVLSGAKFAIKSPNGNAISGSPFTSNANGVVCVDGLALGDYKVSETTAPTGYAIDDSTEHTVTVSGTNAKCSDSSFGGQTLTFTDTPLTNISAHAESQATGGTQSKISCVDSDAKDVGNSPEPNSGFADPVTATANGLKPGTYTCTIVIDP